MKWYIRLMTLFFMFVCAGSAFAEASTIALPPELAKSVGEAQSLQKLSEQIEQCTKDAATCKKSADLLKADFATVLTECHSPCKTHEEWKKGECVKKPMPTKAAKALHGTAPVRFVPCLPPSKAEGGICWCDDARTKTGDVVAAKTFGKNEGACVPTTQLFDRFVSEVQTTFKYSCTADSATVSAEELAKYGINEPLSPSDPICKKTGVYVLYLIEVQKRFHSKQLTPENWEFVWNDYLKRNGGDKLDEGDSDIAEMKVEIAKIKERVSLLEQKGTHVQLMASGFYNARSAQDTYGLTLRSNIIQMFNKDNGVMFGFGFGAGWQPYSKEAMWLGSVSWYRTLNQTSESSQTLFALHLGGYVEGGWLLNNVQDEMQGGPMVGLQIMYKYFVAGVAGKCGIGRAGLYRGDPKDRVGYTGLGVACGPELTIGGTFF